MKIQHITMIVFVLFNMVACATTNFAPSKEVLETVKPEPKTEKEFTPDNTWSGMVTVDFETTPPTVRALPLVISSLINHLPASVLSLGEVLTLELEADDHYVYGMPEKCGDTHILAKVILLKTGDKSDVGFQMQPLEDCVLVPRAFWYDNNMARVSSGGREVYKFTLQEGMTMLSPPDMSACRKVIAPTTPRN